MVAIGLMGALLLAGQATPPRPRTDPKLWIRPGDHPHGVERPRPVNIVGVRLTVGKTGYVTACEVLRSSGISDYDQVTCRIFRSRGRYHPARDAAGRPIIGHARVTVSWRLPALGH